MASEASVDIETGNLSGSFGEHVAHFLAAAYHLECAHRVLLGIGDDAMAAKVKALFHEAWAKAGEQALGTQNKLFIGCVADADDDDDDEDGDDDDAPAADPEPAPELAGV